MAILKLKFPFENYTGKHHQKSDSYVMNRYGTLCTVKIGERDYTRHPKRKEEIKNQQRMAIASKEYNDIDRQSEQWQKVVREFEAQKVGGYHSIRSYYIGTRLKELKAKG